MNSGYKRRRLLAAGLAVAAVGGGVTAAAPHSAAAAAASDRPGCTRIEVTEPTVRIYANEPITDPANPPVGAMAVYLDPLQDASGQSVGSTAGHLDILKRDSAGHTIESISETLQLSDGALVSTGVYDRTEILSGAWVEAPINGVSGGYAGKHGIWRWRMTSHTAPWPVQEQIVLCGGDDTGS
ncbi:hypothetical protein KGA66_11555 [Actinocrinis puniceicyclus]|uniref:Allene oxide cyclase barrel-like domain-containing protein n=1 Tax=Actinocrinis puniceicyclus TaxID=977794 RepID=A0A8J7WJZ5_9ACTN|nr:hypothetical protein [Actinocrinis puniceicyclus]MBS2963688.1 hypothetical protein [Actinocrinis puniceicyclus]